MLSVINKDIVWIENFKLLQFLVFCVSKRYISGLDVPY